MTKTLPPIYGYSIENMKQKILDMMSLGYTREEVVKMTKTSPTIYSHSIENIFIFNSIKIFFMRIIKKGGKQNENNIRKR